MGVSSEQLTSLLDRHWGPLLAWVGIQNPAAEDVVRQAFISLASQSSVPDHPVAWLYQTSRRLAINESTQAARRRRHAIVARSESLSPNPWKSTEAAELVEKLSQLDEAQRQVNRRNATTSCSSVDKRQRWHRFRRPHPRKNFGYR